MLNNSAKPTPVSARTAADVWLPCGTSPYRRPGGRNVPAAQLAAYREATENYRRFMALVDEYVDLMSERAAQEIAREAGDG